jgi:ATP-dependent DNA helicase DinG
MPKLPAELALADPEEDKSPEELPDPKPIDARAVAEEFGPRGSFAARLAGYEYRRQQAEMAQTVARALNRGEHLLVEAGTGTGKSMAYLLPAYRFAVTNDERVVIATHTINLQEQLWTKDLPLLGDVLGVDVPCALVKGRANYLCLRKWLDLVEDEEPFMSTEERLFHVRLAIWLNSTLTGDRSELNLYGQAEQMWARVASDGLACQGSRCGFNRGGCYVMRARRAAEQARVLIVNHSLLFADLQMDNRVLPTYRHLVIDEAHNIEAAATQHLGADYGHASLRSWLASLFAGFRGGNPGYLGILRGRLQRLSRRVPGLDELSAALKMASRWCEVLARRSTSCSRWSGGSRATKGATMMRAV